MKFGYTIIYVADVQAAADFYRQAFGIVPRFVHESGYAELETGSTALAFASHQLGAANLPAGYAKLTEMPQPAGFEIALVTDNVATAMQQAIAAGATLIAEPKVKPWGQTVGYVRSPDGTLIELCTPVGG